MEHSKCEPGPTPAQVRRRSAYIDDLLNALREQEGTPGNVEEQLFTINDLSWKMIRSNPDGSLRVIDRIFRQLDLQAKMKISAGSNRRVTDDPEWQALRECIFRALELFPDARWAVAAALAALEKHRPDLYGGVSGEFGNEQGAPADSALNIGPYATKQLQTVPVRRRGPMARKRG